MIVYSRNRVEGGDERRCRFVYLTASRLRMSDPPPTICIGAVGADAEGSSAKPCSVVAQGSARDHSSMEPTLLVPNVRLAPKREEKKGHQSRMRRDAPPAQHPQGLSAWWYREEGFLLRSDPV